MVAGARLESLWSAFLHRRFLDSKILTLKDVVDLVGPDSLGLRAICMASQLQEKWCTTCTVHGSELLGHHCT